jgi:hypothetical protein
MEGHQLLGVPLEPMKATMRMADPVVDVELPGGRAWLTAVPDRALLRVYGIGAFEVERGHRIRLRPEAGAPSRAVSYWLHSAVASLLLAQRGQFALHASVVQVAGVAVAVCGERGAGKSTTALRLAQRGHPLVTDDVSVLALGDGVKVHPLAYRVRVLPESARRLGLDTSRARRVPRQLKLVMPAPSGVSSLPLAAIAELEHDGRAKVSSIRVRGAKAHWTVDRNAHRGWLFRLLWEAEMFAWAGKVAATVPVHAVTRPAEGWTVDAVAETVEEIAAGRG